MTWLKDDKIPGAVFLATILSCTIAFYNKFPLVYTDTGTYINAIFTGQVPLDRPIFYSFLIRIFSLGISFWPVIFVQGLLVSYLNYLTLGMYFKGLKRDCLLLILTLFLSLFTGYSYNVSILIPDIFSAITLLCVINLLFNHALKTFQQVTLSVIFLFALCTQFSSVVTIGPVLAILFIVLIIKLKRREESFLRLKSIVIVIVLFASTFVIIPTTHFLIDKQFKISGANHVFFMNRLVETGVLEEYLEEACKTKNYKICAYKDSLGWDFIWNQNSPVYKTGGWEANRKEYKAIVKDVFKQPQLVELFLIKSVENSLKQFFNFDVTLDAGKRIKVVPFDQIHWRYKHLHREFLASKQSNDQLNLLFVNQVQFILVLAAMLLLLLFVLSPVFHQKMEGSLFWSILALFLFSIFNSIVCANLAANDPRYQNRLVWLFPFFALIVVFKWMEGKEANHVLKE